MNFMSVKVSLLGTLLIGSLTVFASNAQSPTPEQLKMFQGLPASQQQALAKQYGISLPDNVGTSVSSEYKSPEVMKIRPKKQVKKSKVLQGGAPLYRFGLELFASAPTTFAPISDVPVPANYQISAGDELIIQLFGKDNSTNRLLVNREGVINFPSLGPIQVAGMSFSAVRSSLTKRVKEQMIGVRSDISMGKMRTMQVFVMGDAYKPGAYTVSGLTTISQAIYYSGGFAQSGALRDIQLKRDGKLIRRLDMYELLLKGDTSNDVRLLSGDVVFIGPVKQTVSVDGEINRPAIYEVKANESIAQIVAMAGGITPSAVADKALLKRTANNGSREVLTVNLTDGTAQQLKVKNGDELIFAKRKDELQRFVKIDGDVQQPGYFQWQDGMRVSDVFGSLETTINSSADVHYALVVREVNAQRDIQVFQFDLANAILSPKSSDNIKLSSRDNILVFNRFNGDMLDELNNELNSSKSLDQAQQKALNEKLQDKAILNGDTQLTAQQIKSVFQGKNITAEEVEQIKRNTRRTLLTPILIKLQQQAVYGLPALIAEVTGEVKYPGRYPINSANYTIKNLIIAAGGLSPNAYIENAELARSLGNEKNKSASVEILRISLKDALLNSGGDNTGTDSGADNITIHAEDRLNVLAKVRQKQQSTVVLQGEVLFPGTYTVRRGESLNSLLQRAGGLTQYAHPQGAIFTREALRLQEQKLLNDYAAEMRKETARKTFRADSNTGSAISDPDKTLAFVEEASKSKALGRMVVELAQIQAGVVSADFMLEDGDFLFVPTFRNTVSIMGEVQVAITYLLDNKIDVDGYINKAGGIKKQADEDRVFVVRADGSVYKPNSGYWFGNNDENLKPGDTIVVPLDTDYRDALSTWTAATQILYQTGVAIKALN